MSVAPAIPRRVFVFSGHLVDEERRATPRFPNDEASVGRVRRALDDLLEALNAGPDDLALTQGACGGDLLFSALCIDREVSVRWLQPDDEEAFVANSVARGGMRWLKLYAAVRETLERPPLAMQAALGRPVDEDCNPYARCNRWLLDTACAYGGDKLQFIALWDFGPADGPGGTAGMIAEAMQRTDRVMLVDVRSTQ